MSIDTSTRVSVRNHLSALVRLRKAVIGCCLFALSFYLLFVVPYEGLSAWLLLAMMLIAFLSFGLGWSGLSQGVLGWSRQVDFDFSKCEVSQRSPSFLGRSRAYVVPFFRIADFKIHEGPVSGEGGLMKQSMIDLLDKEGSVMIKAGMFDSAADAQAMVNRIGDAITMAHQQEKPGY
ncbi:hypothetical protein [uncultured Cohaesibacter sp.]|uniref:hypothetical protein n=1 Tax=uncultured Cohaesibacter sp. TaxID=1002546 RepID=UPI00292E45B6|nr:hypothetical protein [uncultured Cohaesibacter sp.]